MSRIAAWLSLVCLLGGCAGTDALKEGLSGLSEMFGESDSVDPPAPLEPLESSVKLTKLWDASVGKGYGKQYLNLVPAVTDSRVFAAERGGDVEARDRSTGQKLWSIDTELALSSGPAVREGLMVAASSDAAVVALNPEDGSTLWQTTVSSEVLAFPQITEDVVVIRSSDGRIVGLDEKTGVTLWYHERSVPPLSVRSRGAPAIAGDLVLDGYASGKLTALNLADGKVAWESTVSIPHGRSEIERLVDVDAVPVVKGGTAYVSGYHGGVAAVSLSDGDILWRREGLSAAGALTASRRSLFLSDAVGDVWQLDMGSGADLWKQDALHQRRLTAPVPVKDYLVVGDFEGYLHLLSQEDGSLVGRIQITDEPIESAPVVLDDIIYAYASDGTLAAVTVD